MFLSESLVISGYPKNPFSEASCAPFTSVAKHSTLNAIFLQWSPHLIKPLIVHWARPP